MAELINLKTFADNRGNLTIIEKILPFEIKRIFFIYGVNDSERGGHRHKTTIQGAVSIQGSCEIWNSNGDGKPLDKFPLDSPSKCMLLEPKDWHVMKNFTPDAILMVFASEYFDPEDYIYQPYEL